MPETIIPRHSAQSNIHAHQHQLQRITCAISPYLATPDFRGQIAILFRDDLIIIRCPPRQITEWHLMNSRANIAVTSGMEIPGLHHLISSVENSS